VDIKTLDGLLRAGVTHSVSDLHFRPGAPPLFRINGTMTPVKYERLLPSHTEIIAGHFLASMGDRIDIKGIQEYDTSYSIPGVARFRVNIYRQRGSLAIVARVIPTEVPTVESLGLPTVLNTIAAEERGLVLVTGATGSGKSTTLAAMINLVNHTRACHILTIEDPIEFLHMNRKASVSQREIGPDTKNYVIGLRAALRQDPDVILVGEMRDAESIDIALKAAETGHMVFSTVHTTDAAKTIGRITSVFPADEQLFVRTRLADNLKATISQRLLPRADGKGRVVAMEVMIVTQTAQEYIRDPNRTDGIKDVIEKGRQQYGMQSFDQHLSDLYRSNVITLQTAIHAATNPSDFERALSFE
jgi:twitching motility protein PilT